MQMERTCGAHLIRVAKPTTYGRLGHTRDFRPNTCRHQRHSALSVGAGGGAWAGEPAGHRGDRTAPGARPRLPERPIAPAFPRGRPPGFRRPHRPRFRTVPSPRPTPRAPPRLPHRPIAPASGPSHRPSCPAPPRRHHPHAAAANDRVGAAPAPPSATPWGVQPRNPPRFCTPRWSSCPCPAGPGSRWHPLSALGPGPQASSPPPLYQTRAESRSPRCLGCGR